MPIDINRRYFLKFSLVTLSGLGLTAFIKGCAQNQVNAAPGSVKTPKLDSHPAIPTPPDRCYLGWHHDMGYRGSGSSDYWLHEKSAQQEKQILSSYKNKIGSLPAVHSIADDFLGSSYFPEGVLQAATDMGVYPMMRYFPSADWTAISKGLYDHHLQRFSQQVSQAALPAFFIPFPGVGHYDKDHPWINWDPQYFIPAWNRMFNIFELEGANRFLVWGLHLTNRLSGSWNKRPYYQVPSEQVDWVGVSIWNHSFKNSQPFEDLLGDDYSQLTTLYRTKPFAIWELGDRHRGTDWFYRYSSKWFERTYTAIENLPRCKLVVFYDYRWFELGVENQLFKKRNIEMIKNVGTRGHYLTGGKDK
ncbi:MAG: hypothetical protein R3274_06630, partial [Desulfobacterales bacterium]|nr:hypothetical protein [Desulfobacterales bacterium]